MKNIYRRIEFPEMTVTAIQFSRDNIAECIIFTDSALKNFRVASDKEYHKFHCSLFGRNICEGMWIVRLPDGELTEMDDKSFNNIYEKVV